MVPPETEDALYRRVLGGLTRFLDKVRELINAAFNRFRTNPSPAVVFEATPIWRKAVDDVVDFLKDMVRGSDDDPIVLTQLDFTRNLLKGIPDEVYRLVLREVIAGATNGETPEQMTERVDKVLDASGSERWSGRARVIAATESTRAWNAGLYASGLKVQQGNRRPLYKEWLAHDDDRVRPTHHEADGQRVLLSQPFQVGTALLMFPGDATGPPDEVIACRCALSISPA